MSHDTGALLTLVQKRRKQSSLIPHTCHLPKNMGQEMGKRDFLIQDYSLGSCLLHKETASSQCSAAIISHFAFLGGILTL